MTKAKLCRHKWVFAASYPSGITGNPVSLYRCGKCERLKTTERVSEDKTKTYYPSEEFCLLFVKDPE